MQSESHFIVCEKQQQKQELKFHKISLIVHVAILISRPQSSGNNVFLRKTERIVHFDIWMGEVILIMSGDNMSQFSLHSCINDL